VFPGSGLLFVAMLFVASAVTAGFLADAATRAATRHRPTVHLLTALGLTAGFLDAQMLAHDRTFQSYRRRRTSENRVPEMLAVSLHEIFAGASEDAAQMQRALFEIWRRDPGERLRSMRFLAAQDTVVNH
jgi:hypothetical protein